MGEPQFPTPADEVARLAILKSLEVLDAPPERDLDDLVRIAARLADMPIAVLSLIDERHQRIRAAVGLDLADVPRSVAFCAHTIAQSDEFFVVNDSLGDARFKNNPFVTADPHVRFYAGSPVMVDGCAVGSVCFVDRVPRELSESTQVVLRAFRRQFESNLLLRRVSRQLTEVTGHLEREREQRAQLTEFLVHDIHNGLAAITLEASLLGETEADAREAGADIGEAAERVRRLAADLLDLNRAALGRGLVLNPSRFAAGALLSGLSGRFQRAASRTEVELLHDIDPSVDDIVADHLLLERALTNLLDNALRFSPRGSSVRLSVRAEQGLVVFTVEDHGPGVPQASRESLFDLYQRGPSPRGAGRGIGLAFCRMVAERSGGRCWVTPAAPTGSCFHLAIARGGEGQRAC